MKIQDFINNQNKYKVDKTYQREVDAWSTEDNQCLIDTIIKGEPMPLFFLNYISDKDIYYIVDGQQRLNAIKKFYDNKLKLNGKYSGKALHGKTFNSGNHKEGCLDNENKKAFLEYVLNIRIMKNYDDERIRSIFSRLQRGKPLQLGEKLNACPGNIVFCMREIANHKFLAKSAGVPKNRYGNYPDAARILFYETYGTKQCGTNELFKYFEEKSDMNKNSKEFKNAINTLNYLEECFPAKPGNYDFLEKHAWVFAVYTMVRDLKMFYSLNKHKKDIFRFVRSFHEHVYNEDFRPSNRVYQTFYENIRGGWSDKIITLRRKTLIDEFLKENKLEALDNKRQLNKEKRIGIFSKLDPKLCPECKKTKFKSYRDPEYHHEIRYVDGGKTIEENIKAICKNCHKRIHGKYAITLSSEESLDGSNGDE